MGFKERNRQERDFIDSEQINIIMVYPQIIILIIEDSLTFLCKSTRILYVENAFRHLAKIKKGPAKTDPQSMFISFLSPYGLDAR
jgi:hypothetical protein